MISPESALLAVFFSSQKKIKGFWFPLKKHSGGRGTTTLENLLNLPWIAPHIYSAIKRQVCEGQRLGKQSCLIGFWNPLFPQPI